MSATYEEAERRFNELNPPTPQEKAASAMLAALEKIANGNFPGGTTMIIAGRWAEFVTTLQEAARKAVIEAKSAGIE